MELSMSVFSGDGLRSARALVRLTQAKLAEKSKVGIAQLKILEMKGEVPISDKYNESGTVNRTTVDKLLSALRKANVEPIIDENGVWIGAQKI